MTPAQDRQRQPVLAPPSAASASEWLPLLREALAREGHFLLPLRGGSMLPTLPTECQVEVVPLPDHVPLGSMVVFVSGDTLVGHRLVRRRGPLWIMQGDARTTPDRPQRPDQILGLVRAAYRADGHQCWPRRRSGLLALYWLARYHVLRGGRAARRLLHTH